MKLKYIEEVEYVGDYDIVVFSKKSRRKLVAQFTSPEFAEPYLKMFEKSKKLIIVSAPLSRRYL